MTKRGRRIGWATTALVLLSASAAAAQQERVEEMARIRAGLPPEAAEQIQQVMNRARNEGLPTDPLLDKAVEGLAKGVSAPMIVGAVDRLAAQLGEARSLLQAGPDARTGVRGPTEVAAVADALRRGVPQQAIRHMAERSRRGEPLALAVHTLGDLIDEGVPVDEAVAVLDAWRGRGARADELRDIPAAVERMIRQGSLPAQAAAAVAHAMHQGTPPGLMGDGPPGRGHGKPGTPPVPPGAGPPTQRGHGPGQHGGQPGGGQSGGV